MKRNLKRKCSKKGVKVAKNFFVLLNRLKRKEINLNLLLLDRINILNYIKRICKNRFIIRKTIIVYSKCGHFKTITKYTLENLNIFKQISKARRKKKLNKNKWCASVATKRHIIISSPVTIEPKLKPITETFQEVEYPPENVRDKIKEQLLLLHMGKKSVDISNEQNFTDAQLNASEVIDFNEQTSPNFTDIQATDSALEKIKIEKQNGVCEKDKSDNAENLKNIDAVTSETVSEDTKSSETINKRQSIIDSLINKFQLKNNMVDIKKPLKIESDVKLDDKKDVDDNTENIEIPKKLISIKEDDESSSGDFYGFSDNDILNSKWTNPDILATPIAPNPNKSVFVSEDLDNFMRENSLDNINSCNVPNVFKYKPLIEGMVCDGSHPPMLCLPPRIESYAQKPRTLAEKRLLFKKKKDFRFLMMENQSSTYHAFTKRLKTNHIDKVVIESIQNQNVPFDRNCWQLVSWLNTDYLKFYFQVLDVDGEVYKLIGGRGGYARKDFSRTQSSAPYTKYLNEPCPHSNVCKNIPSNLKITVYNPNLDETMFLENINSCPKINMENNTINMLYQKYKNIDLKKITPAPLSRKCKKLNTFKDPDCDSALEPYRIPHVELEVWPKLNYPLDPSIRPYLKMILPHTNITNDWANFAVSTVQCKNQDGINLNKIGDDEIKSHTFKIPYEIDQKCIIVRRIKSQLTDYKTLLSTPSTAISSIDNQSQNHQSNANINLDDLLQNSHLNFLKKIDKNNPIEVDCGSVVEDMINAVTIGLCENLFIDNDPDINYNKNNENNKLITKNQLCDTVGNGNNTSLYQNNKIKLKNGNTKMLSELRKLNATIINASDDSVDSSDDEETCDNDFCKMGCVCSSLAKKQNTQNRHCKEIDCVFQCRCLSNGNMNIKDDLTMEDLRYLREKATESLAKEEKEFSSTIIVKNNNTIIVQDPKKDSKRCKKAPKRFSDYQFANDIYEKFSYEIIKNSNRNEKMKKIKNDNLTLDGKILENNKKIIKLNLTNAAHCSVKIRRLEWLEDLEPWCMIHCLYKCFCNGDALDGEPFSLTDSITGIKMQQTVATTTDKDLLTNTTIPRIRNFTFDSAREYIKSDKKQLAKKQNTKVAAAVTTSSIKRQSTSNDQHMIKRTRATALKDISKETVSSLLSPSVIIEQIKEPVKLDIVYNQLENINCNDNLSAARLRKVATDYYVQRNRARRASVFKSITRNNNYENLKLILQQKIQTAIKYDNGKRKEKISIDLDKNKSLKTNIKNDPEPEITPIKPKRLEEPIYISVDLKNIGKKDKSSMISLLKKRNNFANTASTVTMATTDTTTEATSAEQSLATAQIHDNTHKNSVNKVEVMDNKKPETLSTPSSNKLIVSQDVFINRFNNKVSLVMQRICDLLRHNSTFDDLPEKNIMNFIKWEDLINLYTNDKVFIWLINSDMNDYILALTTVQCVPVADIESNIVNIKAVNPDSFPLLAKLISLKVMTPKMKQVAVILYGCENYWRINGIFNGEKELNGSFIVKPTTQTHPNLASKIMRVRNLIALQQQQNLHLPENHENPENVGSYFISKQKLKSNVQLVPLTKSELDIMCVPIRIDSAHRWLVLTVYNDFTALYLPSRKCFIKHDVIMATIKLAQELNKFVRINNLSRIVPDIYGIPNSKNKIFLGPYDLYTDVDVVLCDTFNGEIVTRENYENRRNIQFPNRTYGAWLILHRGNICSTNNVLPHLSNGNLNDSNVSKENDVLYVEEDNGNRRQMDCNMDQDDDCIIIEDSSEHGMNMPIIIDDDEDPHIQNKVDQKTDDLVKENNITIDKVFVNQKSGVLPATIPFPFAVMKATDAKNTALKQLDKKTNNVAYSPTRFAITTPIITTGSATKVTASPDTVAPSVTKQTSESIKIKTPINVGSKANKKPAKANEKLIQLESGTMLKVRPMLQYSNTKTLSVIHVMKTPSMSASQMSKLPNENNASMVVSPSSPIFAKDSLKINSTTCRIPPPLRCLMNKDGTAPNNMVFTLPTVTTSLITSTSTSTTKPNNTAISTSTCPTTVTTKKPIPSLKPFYSTSIPDIDTIAKKLPASTSVSIEKIVNDPNKTIKQDHSSDIIDLTASLDVKQDKSSDDPFKIERTGQFSFRILDTDIIPNDNSDASRQELQNSNKKKINNKSIKRNSVLSDSNAIPMKLMKFSRKSLPNIIKMDDKVDLQQQSTVKKNLTKEMPPKLLLLSVRKNSLNDKNDSVVSETNKDNDNNDKEKIVCSDDCDNNLKNDKNQLVKLIKVCDKSILKNNCLPKTSSLLFESTKSSAPSTTLTSSDNINSNELEMFSKTKRKLTDDKDDSYMDQINKKLKTDKNTGCLKKIVKTSDEVPPSIVIPTATILSPSNIGATSITKIVSHPNLEILESNKTESTLSKDDTIVITSTRKSLRKSVKINDNLINDNVIEILSDEESNVNVPVRIRTNINKLQPGGFLISNIIELGCIPTCRQPNNTFILKLPKVTSLFKFQDLDAVNNYLNKYIRQHIYGVLFKKDIFSLKWQYTRVIPSKYSVMDESTLNADMVLTQYGLINLTEKLSPSLRLCFAKSNLYLKYLKFKMGHVLISSTELRECSTLEILKLAFKEIERLKNESLNFDEEKNIQHRKNCALLKQLKTIIEKRGSSSDCDKLEKLKQCLIDDDMVGEFYANEDLKRKLFDVNCSVVAGNDAESNIQNEKVVHVAKTKRESTSIRSRSSRGSDSNVISNDGPKKNEKNSVSENVVIIIDDD